MMALSKEFLTTEIEKAEIAVKQLTEGLALNELVLKAFNEELKNAA